MHAVHAWLLMDACHAWMDAVRAHAHAQQLWDCELPTLTSCMPPCSAHNHTSCTITQRYHTTDHTPSPITIDACNVPIIIAQTRSPSFSSSSSSLLLSCVGVFSLYVCCPCWRLCLVHARLGFIMCHLVRIHRYRRVCHVPLVSAAQMHTMRCDAMRCDAM